MSKMASPMYGYGVECVPSATGYTCNGCAGGTPEDAVLAWLLSTGMSFDDAFNQYPDYIITIKNELIK